MHVSDRDDRRHRCGLAGRWTLDAASSSGAGNCLTVSE
jgi:hypothetical protein